MNIDFRNLHPDEIDVRIGVCNDYGVTLLLYKDARCDQTILDETVGPLNWQRHHARDNANCTVSIYDDEKKSWIEKEDTGKESNTEAEKGLASDSFKRACFNWGIGRELYSASELNLFFKKNQLKTYKIDPKKNKPTCSDKFRVTSIEYDVTDGGKELKKIKSIVIENYYGSEIICQKKFEKGQVYTNKISSPQATATSQSNTSKPPVQPPVQQAKAQTSTPQVSIADSDEILMGNCRGKKYGDVKNTPEFQSFLKWAKNSKASYPDEKTNKQFNAFKQMALNVAS